MSRPKKMTKLESEILEGLDGAVAYSQGETARGRAHVVHVPVPDIAALRKRIGLSQDKFARAFGVSAGTLRNWEQGRHQPPGAARVPLGLIDREPEAVARTLKEILATV